MEKIKSGLDKQIVVLDITSLIYNYIYNYYDENNIYDHIKTYLDGNIEAIDKFKLIIFKYQQTKIKNTININNTNDKDIIICVLNIDNDTYKINNMLYFTLETDSSLIFDITYI